MTTICPRLLNLINDFVLLRFRARAPEDLSAIEVILLLLLKKIKFHDEIIRFLKHLPLMILVFSSQVKIDETENIKTYYIKHTPRQVNITHFH